MDAKQLGILSVVTVVAVGAAGYGLLREGSTRAEEAAEERLFPGLDARVNDVRRVTLETDDSTVTLALGDDGWGLVERGGYPAKFDQVKETVVKLAQLEIREPKTAKSGNHAKLGVADPGGDPPAEGARGKRVTLQDGSGATLAAAIVGDTGVRGTFVRRDGEDQVYLCDDRLALSTTPTSWIDTTILRLESERVAEVTIQHHDGPDVLVERDPQNATQFRLVNVPEGREVDYPGVANGIGTALSFLTLSDVRPRDEVDLAGAPVAFTTYRCDDGLTIELTLAEVDGARWIAVDARHAAPNADLVGPLPEPAEGDSPEPVEGGDSPELVEDGDSPELVEDDPAPAGPTPEALAAAADEAEALSVRLSGWAFQIPEYKANAIARPLEDLLKDLEEPAGLADPDAPFDAEFPDELDQLLQQAVEETPPADDGDQEPAPATSEDG